MVRIVGTYERVSTVGETVNAFMPSPLPPREPPLVIDIEFASLLHRAEAAVAGLKIAAAMVPSLDWLLYSFVRKEAVITSQIEGTQATLVDLLMYEAVGKANTVSAQDVNQVCNYMDALIYARNQMRSKKGLPLSIRLLNEAHKRLMKNTAGADRHPGEIRRSQNWIGGTRPGNAAYVPPRLTCWAICLDHWKSIFTRKIHCPHWFGLAYCMFNSKPSTLTWMATAVWVGF